MKEEAQLSATGPSTPKSKLNSRARTPRPSGIAPRGLLPRRSTPGTLAPSRTASMLLSELEKSESVYGERARRMSAGNLGSGRPWGSGQSPWTSSNDLQDKSGGSPSLSRKPTVEQLHTVRAECARGVESVPLNRATTCERDSRLEERIALGS